MHEGIPILNFLVPKAFTHEDGRLTGVVFEKVAARHDDKGRRKLVPTGEPDVHFECDDVLVAVGQENAFPWIERDIGLEFDAWGMPVVDPVTMQSTPPKRVLRRRRRVRAQEHHLGRRARPRGGDLDRPALPRRGPPRRARRRTSHLVSQKMGIHEWSYDNDISPDRPLPACRMSRPDAWRSRTSRSRSSSASTASSATREAAALPQLRRRRRCSPTPCASSATPASTSARSTASPSRPTAPEADLRTRLQRAGAEPRPGPLRLRPAEDRPRHGQGRGRLPALRPLRRALPDRRLGHAEVPPRMTARRPDQRMPQPLEPRPTTSSSSSPTSTAPARRSANRLFAKSILRMGVPVALAQHLPVQHPGPADLVRGAGQRGRLSAAGAAAST